MVGGFPLIIIIILYPYEERPGGLREGKELALLLMLLFPPFTLRPAPSVGKAWVGGSRASRVAPLTGSIQLPPSGSRRGRRQEQPANRVFGTIYVNYTNVQICQSHILKA